MASIEPKRSAIKRGELGNWFSLSKYSEGVLPATPAAWVPIIAARAHLLTRLRHGHREQVLGQFEKIKANPAVDLGFDFLGSRGTDPLDRPSLRSITMKMLDGMKSNASVMPNEAEATYDRAYSQHLAGGQATRFAHIRIDFAATKAKVKRDFELWLNDVVGVGRVTNRPYDNSTITRWVEDKILPYADLHIFAEASRKRISPSDFLFQLDLPDLTDLPRDSLKTQIRALTEVFNHDTEVALHMATLPSRVARRLR